MTVRLVRPLELATVLMCSFWVRELENEVMRELGKREAKKREAEPQPQLDGVSGFGGRGEGECHVASEWLGGGGSSVRIITHPRSKIFIPSLSSALST